MKKFVWIAVLAVVVVLLVGAVYVAYQSRQQAIIWTHPARNPVQGDPESVQGLADWEAVTLTTSDSLALQGWFIPADAASNPDGAAVILLHGLGGNRVEMLERADILHRNGYHTLLLDLRNHGESAGEITTLGFNEVEDVRAAWAYLADHDAVDAAKIAVLGHSMGGATALRAAATIPEIAAVVAESSYRSTAADADRIMQVMTGRGAWPLLLTFVDQVTGAAVSSVSGVTDIQQIAPRPVLIVHGDQDDVILPEAADTLYAAASEPKDLYIVAGAGHSDVASFDLITYEQQVVGFLNQYLRTG